MKRFMSLFIQDLLLAYRSGHVLITGLLLAGMLALVIFLPAELKIHNELILDKSAGSELAAFLSAHDVPGNIVFTDEAAFRSALERQPNKVGVVYSDGMEQPHFEIITSSVVAEQNIGLLEASLAFATSPSCAASLPAEFQSSTSTHLRTSAFQPEGNPDHVSVRGCAVRLFHRGRADVPGETGGHAQRLPGHPSGCDAVHPVQDEPVHRAQPGLRAAHPAGGLGLEANYGLLLLLVICCPVRS
jgi:hypothetical protein